MEKIRVKLKEGVVLPQPTAKDWKRGWLIGFVQMADMRGYAVVQTEHNEFDTVPICSLIADYKE